MKVLHVIPYMHPKGGGPPVVVDRVVAEMANQGIESEILCTDLYSEDHDNAWSDHWASSDQITICPADRQTSFAPSRQMQKKLSDMLPRFDLIHLHTLWSSASSIVGSSCKNTNTPYIVMPHGMLDPNSLKRKRWKKTLYGMMVEYPVLRRAAGMTCTHEEEDRLARTQVKGLPQGFITPLGADEPPDEKATLAREFFEAHPELEGKEIVLFLSRLHEKKGLDLLIPAFAKLREQREHARFLLVGSGTPEYERFLKGLIEQHRVQESVLMTGNLSGRGKWQAMAAANLFALSSYQENFAIVVADAMRMELPIVLSKRVNIWDKIVAANAGITCELNIEDITRQLASVLDDPGQAQQMGVAGKQLVENEFTWKRCAERMGEAYRAVLGG